MANLCFLSFSFPRMSFLPGCNVLKVGEKDHQRFQASYATLLKAHMTSLKKRERKEKKKAAAPAAKASL